MNKIQRLFEINNYNQERRKDMNPALPVIVVVVCIAVWFLASSLYKPIGRFIGTIGKDAIDNMKDEEESEEKER